MQVASACSFASVSDIVTAAVCSGNCEHAHRAAAPQLLDEVDLPGGTHAGSHVGRGDARPPGERRGGGNVVAGQHHDSEAGVTERLDRLLRIGPVLENRFIKQTSYTHRYTL